MNLKINVRSRRNRCNSFLIKMVHFSRSHGLGHHLTHLVSCIYGSETVRLVFITVSCPSRGLHPRGEGEH